MLNHCKYFKSLAEKASDSIKTAILPPNYIIKCIKIVIKTIIVINDFHWSWRSWCSPLKSLVQSVWEGASPTTNFNHGAACHHHRHDDKRTLRKWVICPGDWWAHKILHAKARKSQQNWCCSKTDLATKQHKNGKNIYVL